jgi:hypothetical protein
VAIKNGQSIETDNCLTTIIYFLSFTVTIFMYQTQLINTEILSDKIKRTINNIEHIFMYLVVEEISIPILMLCLFSLWQFHTEVYDI